MERETLSSNKFIRRWVKIAKMAQVDDAALSVNLWVEGKNLEKSFFLGI